MNDLIVEVLALLAALLFGPMWYSEYTRRQRAEAELAVEKVRKPLEELNKEIIENWTEYNDANLKLEPIPEYMLELVRPVPDAGSEAEDPSGGRSSEEAGPKKSGGELQ